MAPPAEGSGESAALDPFPWRDGVRWAGDARAWARRRWERRTPEEARLWLHQVPLLVLAAAVAYWLRIFLPLVIDQQRNYATFDYDLGIFDQAAWLVARGQGFISLRGLPFLGHHLNLGLLLFAPFYWLGAGPELLNAAMALALAATVVPITAIARHYRPTATWFGVGFSVAFLFSPVTQAMLVESFHPEKMAVPFLFGALWAALGRRWRWFAACAVLAVIWKEDLALVFVVLGLGVAWKRDRRIGLVTAGLAALYLVVATRLVIPHFAGGGTFYDGFLGPLGDSPFALAGNLVTRPQLFADRYNANHGLDYLVDLQAPFLFTPLVSPSTLLLALPAYLVNVLSSQGYTQQLDRHYVIVPFVASLFSAVRGTLSRSTAAIRAALTAGMVLALVWAHNGGTGPWAPRHDEGIWGLVHTPHHAVLDRAVAQVPDGESVAASYFIAPHLSRRAEVYTFPNPWHPVNWGLHDEGAPAPSTVRWIVVDRSAAADEPVKSAFERVTTSRCFTRTLDEDGVVVLHRTAENCAE